ncbi:hypothetical protein [Sutcliffiella deserti]|uniref:hypothetical protein n=1 Tax=Sutcliffiella deserti TaxID=2875501 RepID=UPI001CC1B12F|nr:hypothetical protein [Sutcliffiella deserti]
MSGKRYTRETIQVPELEPVNRSREYNLYEESLRNKVVYEYLFNSESHRGLDERVLGLDADESRGYQAMGILHYIGLKGKHKGIFKELSIKQAIELLERQQSNFSLVVQSLNSINSQVNNNDRLVDLIRADIDSEVAEEDSYYKDGAVKVYYGKRYERKPENRR